MSGKSGRVLYYEPFFCGIVKLADFGKSCYVYMVNGKNICRLFPRAVSRATALAQAFGECREDQIPRSLPGEYLIINGCTHRRKQDEDHAEPYGLRIFKISAGI